jgi:hypothetical protein
MVQHYFRNPWANNASDPQIPGPAGNDEERAAHLGKRIIEFGLLAVTVLLAKFFTPPFNTPEKGTGLIFAQSPPLRWKNSAGIAEFLYC